MQTESKTQTEPENFSPHVRHERCVSCIYYARELGDKPCKDCRDGSDWEEIEL